MIVSVHKKAVMCLIRNTPGSGVRSTFFAYSDLDLQFHGFFLRLSEFLNEKAGPSEARFVSGSDPHQRPVGAPELIRLGAGVCYFFDNLTASPASVAIPAG